MRKNMVLVAVLLLGAGPSVPQQKSIGDEGGRILALNKRGIARWKKKTKRAGHAPCEHVLSIDIDGSLSSKSEFLAGIKAPDYQPSQAVTEQSNVQVYGDAAVVVGVFRVKGKEKGKPYVRREGSRIRGSRSTARGSAL